MTELFIKYLMGHALCDFALQSDVMAKFKNWNNKPDNIPNGQKLVSVWQYWMASHALIHGGVVYLISGSIWLGAIETVLHFGIDCAKCKNWTNPHQDQLLHVICKMMYLIYA